MKFNGSIFSKPQQDQLKENIGNELEKVSAHMLSYKGDWVSGDEYHENDIVTAVDGQLYEVIKAHTSSDTLKPGNTEYYKAMTSTTLTPKSAIFFMNEFAGRRDAINLLKDKRKSIVAIYVNNDDSYNWHCDEIAVVGSTEMAMLSNTKYGFTSNTTVNSMVFEMLGITVNGGIIGNTLTINTDGTITNSQSPSARSITIYYI